MATDPTDEAFSYLVTTHIPEVVDQLTKAALLATRAGRRDIADACGGILDQLLADVNRIAVEIAGTSEGAIIQRMFATQSHNRPLTASMESHVRSEPGPLGTVRVAMLDELNRIVNPRGSYGPFWRAQEFGTGQDTGDPRFPPVPSQEGRPLFGTFEPATAPPDPAQQGLGAGHDLAFIPFGSAPGLGRIQVELPGRHFLRDGALEAGARYKAAMADVQARAIRELEALSTRLGPRRGGGGGLVIRIEA